MEYFVSINNVNTREQLEKIGVKHFVCGMQQFSCRQSISFDYQQLDCFVRDCKEKVYVLVNALIEEKYLDDLRLHLKKIIECGIEGIFFQDFGVLNICKKLQFQGQMIYAPDTLNTNYATLNVLLHQGVTMAFLAREISLEQKLEIVAHSKMPLMMQVHGVEYMAYSKRHLLTNYYEHHKIEDKGNNFIQATGVDYRCHIYEDRNGTHILSEKQMECLSIFEQVKDIPYGYIESMYLSDNELVDVVTSYFQEDKLQAKNWLQEKYPNVAYYHSFLFDETVYKMEDVRKREADEKNIKISK